jgi:cytoskeletal protein RodZ
MSILNRFKKTPVNPSLPPEIQAYSQAERRERMGVAWLVGIVSLIVSLILIVLLFLGGRWVFRKIAHKDTTAPTPVITRDENKNKATDKPKSTDDTSDSNATSNPSSNSTPNGNGNTAPTPAPQPSTPPANQGTNSTLPNTGPDVDL